MKRLVLFTLLLCAVQQLSFAQLQKNWTWSHSYGGPFVDQGMLTETDIEGNLYTVMYYSDSINIDGVFFPKAKGGIAYAVTKHDADGKFIYARNIYGRTTTSGLTVYGMDVDDSGQVYIVGDFQDSLTFGNIEMSGGTTSYDHESFIAKIDRNGDAMWLRKLGGTLDDHLSDIVVDNAGDIIVTGYFYDYNRQYDNIQVLVPNKGENFLLAKLSADGQYKWVTHSILGEVGIYVSNSSNQINAARIEVDKNNNIYVAGRVDESMSFNGITYDIIGNRNMFLAKFSNIGNYLWSDVAQPRYCDAMGMAIDDNDNIYLSGRYSSDSLYFNGGDTLRSSSTYSYYLVRYNTAGKALWTRGFDTQSTIQRKLSMTTDRNNNLFMAGLVSNIWKYGSDTVKYTGVPAQVIFTIDTTGTILRTDSIIGDINLSGMATDLSNNVYVTGAYSNNLAIGDSVYYDSVITSASIYIAKLEHQPIVTLDTTNGNNFCISDSITVYFSNHDTVFNSSNQFRFELSDDAGSFINAVLLGTYTTSQSMDSVRFILPATLVDGTSYRVRISSTEPVYYTPSGTNITITSPPPQPVIGISPTQLTASVTGGGTLQWYKDGVAVQGATSATIQPQSAGMYTISHTNNAGCAALSNAVYFAPVSVENVVSESNITIAPNPAHTSITINGLKGTGVIEIHDMVGKLLYQQNAVEPPATIIEISNLSTGSYIIHITYGNGERTTAKMVKQ